MPNRILKESLKLSKQVNELSFVEETAFTHLLITVDDYGRYYADPDLLASELFPRRREIDGSAMEAIIQKLEDVGLIVTYTSGEERYLCLPTWSKHQTVRNMKSRFPAPANNCKQLHANDFNCTQLNENENNCEQLQENVPVIQSNPIQTNPIIIQSNARASNDDDASLISDGEKRNEVYDMAASIGLKSTSDLQKIDDLCGTYTDEWVIEALKIAADYEPGKRNWFYVGGILKRWKAQGFIDHDPKPKSKEPPIDFGQRTPWEKHY